jgi:hypothetical protein
MLLRSLIEGVQLSLSTIERHALQAVTSRIRAQEPGKVDILEGKWGQSPTLSAQGCMSFLFASPFLSHGLCRPVYCTRCSGIASRYGQNILLPLT